MIDYSSELNLYLSTAVDALNTSSNVWIKEHSNIISLVENWDWQSDYVYLETKLNDIYNALNLEFKMGLIAITWDDYHNSAVTLHFGEAAHYQEWMSDQWLEKTLDLQVILNNILPNLDTWADDSGDCVDIFKHLLLGLVEMVVINSTTKQDFKKRSADAHIIMSTPWHDCEFSLIHDSKEGFEYELCFPLDCMPVNNDVIEKTADYIVLFGNQYSYSTTWLRGDHSQRGTVPEDISLLLALESIELSGECIHTLPSSLYTLKKLTKLDLSNNRLRILDFDIYNLKTLEYLNLADNKLSFLPESLGLMKNIIQLNLEQNQLKSLPETLMLSQNLEVLNLHDNRLNVLPKLPNNLTWLNLLNNKLTSLPDDFGELKSLKTLVLSHNRFTHVPKQILELNALTSLELGANNIDDLPLALNELPNLTKIRVYPNRFDVEQRIKLRQVFGSKLFLGYDTDEKSFMET